MAAGDGLGDDRKRVVELRLELEAVGQHLDLERLALVGAGEQGARPVQPDSDFGVPSRAAGIPACRGPMVDNSDSAVPQAAHFGR